jgi:hypothetical protein
MFYNLNDAAPDVLPPFVVLADRGCWAAESHADAFKIAAKLNRCGIETKVVKGVWADV